MSPDVLVFRGCGGWNKGSITPVSIELVYQGDEEDAKGVGDPVG